jgi:hypothetical protein
MAPAAPAPRAAVPAVPSTAEVLSAAPPDVEQVTRTLITLLKKSKGRGAAHTLSRAEGALAALTDAGAADTSTPLPGALLQDLVGCMRTTDSGALQAVFQAAAFLSQGGSDLGGRAAAMRDRGSQSGAFVMPSAPTGPRLAQPTRRRCKRPREPQPRLHCARDATIVGRPRALPHAQASLTPTRVGSSSRLPPASWRGPSPASRAPTTPPPRPRRARWRCSLRLSPRRAP